MRWLLALHICPLQLSLYYSLNSTPRHLCTIIIHHQHTARTSALLGPSAALLLNAAKYLANIPHDVKLIPENMIEPIQKTKVGLLHGNNPRLHTDEVLVALSMLSITDDNCRKALDQLPKLRGCQVHCTVMLSEVDHKIFKKLGIGLTCDPVVKE